MSEHGLGRQGVVNKSPVYRFVELPGEWREQAACRQMNTDVFFPIRGPLPKSQFDAIRAICTSCPVREECLDFALTMRIDEGWFGGLSARRRRALLRDRPDHPKVQRPITHGTANGYRQGCRKQCCMDAHAAQRQQSRLRARSDD